MPGGVLGVPGVHLQIFPVNYAKHFFLRPGGAGAPSTPWLRLCFEPCVPCLRSSNGTSMVRI